jgi:2-oxo-4-hydroxy-4-carboxy-5-ureidoimidazoline decarboxylase
LQAHVTDWLEAFAAHPRIGDLDSLKAKFTQFAKSSQTEQATAATASGVILQVLPAL